MVSDLEAKVRVRCYKVISLFSGRISRLPEDLQEDLLSDLKTMIENRLKVLEKIK